MKRDHFNHQLDAISPSGIRRFFDLVVGMDDVISLGVGEPDFSTPWAVCDEAIDRLEKGKTSYTSNNGLLELREGISRQIESQTGMAYDVDSEVLVTVGVSEAVDCCLRATLNPGDEVILPEPTYVCYAPLVEMMGAKVVSIDTSETGFVPTLDAIEAAITDKTKMIILCTPSNPTGMVIGEDVLRGVSRLASQHGFWVMADEIYGQLVYDAPFVSYASLPDVKEHLIYLGGFSKAHAMTGWRIGYVCGPEAVVSRALKIHQYSIMCAPILSQYAAIEALKLDKEIEDMRLSYQHRRNLFVDGLNALGLPTAMPGGAFYCFVDIRLTGLSSEDFAMQLLEAQKVAVVPGHVFGAGGEGFVRCCFATDLEQLKTALGRIEAFLNHLKSLQ